MRKLLFVTILLISCYNTYAQKGGIIYYLKNSGKLVLTKDSADYYMAVFPPDTSINKKMYVVYEYYPNGKVRLVTNSKKKDINLLYQGRYVAYFADGRKKRMGKFEAGLPAGHEVEYYPNGKLHSIVNYNPEGKVIYGECRDSTGKVMAENGSGDWQQFDETFTTVIAEGKIDSGLRVGAWHIKQGDTASLENEYNKGVLTLSLSHVNGRPDLYEKAETDPVFPGGKPTLDAFTSKTFIFPESASLKDVSGTSLITFIVEEDGRLTDFKIKSRVGYGVDEALVAMMKQSPAWIPGTVNGKPVRAVGSRSSVFTTTIVGRVRRF